MSKTATVEKYSGFGKTSVGDVVHYDGDDYRVIQAKPLTNGNTKLTLVVVAE